MIKIRKLRWSDLDDSILKDKSIPQHIMLEAIIPALEAVKRDIASINSNKWLYDNQELLLNKYHDKIIEFYYEESDNNDFVA